MANLLVIDDDRELLRTLCRHLQSAGHNCATETNGARGYELLEKSPPDIVLLDVMMPGISGFEFCRRLRSHPKLYATPVIFMSSMCSEEEVQHALAQGGDDFICKPLRPEQVQMRIQGHLSHASEDGLRDETTGLPGKKQVKLDLQRILNAKVPFSIMYVEMVNLVSFGRSTSDALRLKALRHFARALKQSGHGLEATLFRAGHMGGGHFVVVLDAALARPFSEKLTEVWRQYVPRFYTDLGLEKALVNMGKPTGSRQHPAPPILESLICVTEHDASRLITASEILETLSNIRQRAVQGQQSGIFYDRRTDQATGSAASGSVAD